MLRVGGSVLVQTHPSVQSANPNGASPQDDTWLAALGLSASGTVSTADFLNISFVPIGGCIRNALSTKPLMLPAILTLVAAGLFSTAEQLVSTATALPQVAGYVAVAPLEAHCLDRCTLAGEAAPPRLLL